MKLHLPLSLRAALLAVLASFSFSYAGETKTVTGEESLEEKAYEDLTLIVEDTGELTMSSSKTSLTGISDITVKGTFTLSDGYIGYAYGANITAETTITLASGTFDMSKGEIGYARGESTTAEITITVTGGTFSHSGGDIGYAYGANATTETTITVNGGTFDMSKGEIGYARGESTTAETTITVTGGTFSHSGGNIGHAYGANATAETTITVAGGTFDMSGGYIGRTFRATTTADTMITVNGGSFSISTGGYIGYASGANANADTMITVEDGTFKMSEGYIGRAAGENSTADTMITVEDGTFKMSGGNIGIAYEATTTTTKTTTTTITVEGGLFDMSGGGIGRAAGANTSTETTITVKGETFDMSGGNICYAYGANATATTTITVEGSAFDMLGGYICYAYGANATATTTITVEGSAFDMLGGDIGYAEGRNSIVETTITVADGEFNDMVNVDNWRIGVASGVESTANTTITMKNGTFNVSRIYIGVASGVESTANTTITMEGGTFNVSRPIGWAAGANSTATTTITVKGGAFNMSGGNIGGSADANATAETTITIEGGTFDMSDGHISNVFGGWESSTTRATITVKGGTFDMSGGNIGYAQIGTTTTTTTTTTITVEGGLFDMSSGGIGKAAGENTSTETTITVKGGTFDMSGGSIGWATGDNATAETTITVNGTDSHFTQSGGEIYDADIELSDGAEFEQSGSGSIIGGSITVNDDASFTQQNGGSIGSDTNIVLKDNAQLTLAENGSMSGHVRVEGAGAQYDIGGQAAGGSIDMKGGSLKNAGEYRGSVSIDIESGYKGGSIDMGGVAADKISSVKVKESGVSLSGLKAGTTLTLTGSDNMLTVGSGNTDLDGTGGTALIQFEAGDGFISFNEDGSNTLVLNLAGAILKNLESQECFIIHLTNGEITDWTGKNFAFHGLPEGLGFYVEWVENGDLIIRSGELDNLFRASYVDGQLDDAKRQKNLKDRDAVVMDEDLTIEVGEEFDDDELTLNHVDTWVDDDSKTDLDITNKSGKDLDVNLHNDYDTTLDGNLTVKSEGDDSHTDLEKTGEGTLTVTGNVSTDGDLDVQEGGMGVGGDADIGGGVTVGDSENDKEGSLVVGGDLTTGGDLDIENGEVGVGGDADIGGGVTVGDSENDTEGSLVVGGDLTTGGDLDIENGEVGVGGDADIGGGVTVGDSENGTEGSLVVEGDLTTDGDLDIENGEVGVGGDADIGGGVTVGDSENGTEGSLVVEGDLTTDGDLDIENGKVGVGGDADIGGGVTVGDSDPQTKGELIVDGNLDVEGDLDIKNGDVTLNGDDNHVRGDVHFGDEENGTEGNLEINGSLTVDGDMDLSEGKGSITGDGELHVDGSLTLGENVEFDGPSLDVDGELNMNDQDVTLGGLNGEGTVNGPGNIIIDGEGGDFSGTLTDSGSITVTGEGTDQSFSGVEGGDWDLEVKDGGQLTITGKDGRDSAFHDVEAKSGGKLEFRASGDEAGDHAGAHASLTGALVIYNGSTTRFTFNMNADELWGDPQQGLMVTVAGQIFIEKDAQFIVDSLQRGPQMPEGRSGDLVDVVVMRGGDVSVVEKFTEEMLDLAPMAIQEDTALKVTPEGLFRLYYRDVRLTAKSDHTVVLNATYAPYTVLLEEGVATTRNSYAGVMLLSAVGEDRLVADPTLSRVGAALGDLIAAGGHAVASRVAAAVAGSTVTSLSAAQRDALRSEMNRLRWHARPAADMQPQRDERYTVITTAKGAIKENTAAPAAATWLHAWAEGDAGHMKRHTQGDESGYCLNTWGGAVGADMSLTESLSAGLSLSAQYGDLSAHAADTAKGDLDSYYLSVYARYKPSKWAHTVMLTGSRSEAKLTRCVDYVQGMYESRGSTSGYGVGAAYELSYDIALNAEGSSLLQPLAGLSIIHTSMGGYSEHGAYGAGLNVARQKQTTGTLTLGMRWLAQVGEGVFGRRATAELSLGMAEDLGDVRSTAQVALQANPAFRQRVYGSRAGRAAAQIGGSITLPVTRSAHLYLQGLGELREHANSWNVTAGVRIGF